MDSLLNPKDISGPLQVVKIEDIENGEEGSSSRVELSGPIGAEFRGQWNDDPKKIITARVNFAAMGVDIEPDFNNAEFQIREGAARGRISLSATVRRAKEGIKTWPLSLSLVPLDTLLARIVLVDEDREIKDGERTALIEAIHRNYPAVAQILNPEDSTFSLHQLEFVFRLREKGVSIEDIQRFLFGLRAPGMLDKITERTHVSEPLQYTVESGSSLAFLIQGFTHSSSIGVFSDPENARLVGSKVVFPRNKREIYEKRFLMRLAAAEVLYLRDVKLPVKFYRTEGIKIHGYIGSIPGETFEDLIESFAKVDMEVLPSYPAIGFVFEVLEKSPGEKKALLLKDQRCFDRIMRGDQSLVRSYNPLKRVSAVNPLTLAEDPHLQRQTEHVDPVSYPELQLMEETKDGETGILVCKYFPDKDVLRRLYQHAHKLRAIVFRAPSYVPSPSVEAEKYLLEAHIFFGANEFVSLREFHERFPNIKLIWSHPGVERNLTFVDDGKLPMFAKPEIADDLLHPDSSLRISFCGSSTEKPEMSAEEKAKVYETERAFTKMYCDYAKTKKLKPIGINGGGPDVMDRNGQHLRELGAISVSSACDLGKAGQKRHMNWDAVFNTAGDTTSFALREDVLVSGDIVHIAPGGIGSIEEILKVMAQNKLGMAAKKIFLIGRKYWEGQIMQFVNAAKEGNIKASALSLLFVVDTPDEINGILDNMDKDSDYTKNRSKLWNSVIEGQMDLNQLFEYGKIPNEGKLAGSADFTHWSG